MHAFLIWSVLIEAAVIGWLCRKCRALTLGADEHNERLDSIVAEAERRENDVAAITGRVALIPAGVTETNWSELAAKLYEHTDVLDAAMSRIAELQAALHQWRKDWERRANETDAKVIDLAEGCAKLDADLSTASEDVRECVRLRQSDLAGINERIAEIVDAQEKARRKSGLRNAPAAFESLRAVAESGAIRHPDPEHRKLVALAEGEQ